MNEKAPGLPRSFGVWAVSALLLFVTCPGSSGAQVIQGQLFDAVTGKPINGGSVDLRSRLDSVVARTEADSIGAFYLTAPGPGRYSLMATGLGYQSNSTLRFDMGAEGRTTIDIQLFPEPVQLDSLGVEVERQRIIPYLERQGFYKRVEDGFGHFIEPEEIDRRNPRSFSDLLRSIPNLSVRRGEELWWGPRCYRVSPRLWIDGVLVDEEDRGKIVLGRHVSIDEIAAIEVYQSAAAIPLQYGGTGGHCAMFIWTKGEL